ncbi:hypothetical protein O7632_31440 [Solwaraspora sp. WMMD406]|uniref:hypothetical protein n=1 Tax=Solwaraspora sp. WMMD406 TaxID=3016095 RepID=UPI002417DF1C|nr:hypothetical protein [Solwaraspora sp. WMMD406]MDG4768572.1 hypothetical protein [Solwaraspora sp. WMMD406]
MVVTARRESEATATAAPIRIFLAVRRTRSILLAVAACGVLTAWLGTVEVAVPSAVDHGQGRIPLWRLLAIGAAVLPVLGMRSHLADLEQGVTRTLRRVQRIHLAGIAVACVSIFLALAALTIDPVILLVMLRSWLAWFGLALLAGVLLGWRLAWTLPALVAVTFFYWGYHSGGDYWWWEFSIRPYADVPALLLSIGLFAVGLVAYSMTPWRLRRLRTLLR